MNALHRTSSTRGVSRLTCATFALFFVACGARTDTPIATDTSAGPTDDVIIAPQQYIDFSGCPDSSPEAICPTVNLQTIACSAAIGCRDAFLRDPETNEPQFTLTTSLACGFDDTVAPGETPPVFDSLPGYVSRVTCVDAFGVETTPPTPGFGEHRFFAQATNNTGDFFLNTARIVPRMFGGSPTPVSCTVEAWAALNFQKVYQDPPEARAAQVNQWAPVVQWHAKILPDGSGFDCKESWVQKHVFFATVHDMPDKTVKRAYPAEHASLLLRQQSFVDPDGARTFTAIEGIAWEPVRFPNAPNVPPVPFESRAFVVPYPPEPAVPLELVGRSASLSPRHACIETDAGGHISNVGLAMNFVDFEDSLPPVIVIIDRTGGVGSWDCRREAGDPDAPCVAFGALWDTSWVNVVPCLMQHVPTPPSPVCGVLTPGQVAASQELCSGDTPAPFVVTEPSGGIGPWTYQWEESPDGVFWSPIPGANTNAWVPAATTGLVWYRRIASNTCGTVISAPVSVLVAEDLSPGNIGAEQVLCPGDSPSHLTGTGPNGGLGGWTFQWQEHHEGGSWMDIASANGPSYQPLTHIGSVQYRRVASNVCGVMISNTIQITSYAPLSDGAIGADQQICPPSQPGPIVELDPLNGGSGVYMYTWQESSDQVSWSSVPGATEPDHPTPIAWSTTYFRRIAQDMVCGGTLFSNTVVVLAARGGHVAPGFQSIPSGGSPNPVVSEDDGDFYLFQPPGEFQWERQFLPDPWQEIPGAIQPNLMPHEIDNFRSALYRRRLRFEFCGEDFYSNIVQVDVTP